MPRRSTVRDFVARRRYSPSCAEVVAGVLADEWSGSWQALTSVALGEAFADGGCVLCLLTTQAVDNVVLRLLQAERYPELTERQLRLAQGFCGPHAWWLLGEVAARAHPGGAFSHALADELGGALGALADYGDSDPEAQLNPAIFKRTVRHAWTKKVARRLSAAGKCPLCLLLKRIRDTLGYQLFELLKREQLRAAYGPDSALCLPHLRWALDAAGDKAVLDCLVSAERARLERLVTPGRRYRLESVVAHVAGARSSVVCD